eukprot:SAG11_NODE_8741_length_980_cov_36.174801_1_plen_83_part_00
MFRLVPFLISIRLYSLRNTLNLELVTAVTKKSVLIVICILNLIIMELLKKPIYNNIKTISHLYSGDDLGLVEQFQMELYTIG